MASINHVTRALAHSRRIHSKPKQFPFASDGADINTPFTGIPYPSNALGKGQRNQYFRRIANRVCRLLKTKIGSARVTATTKATSSAPPSPATTARATAMCSVSGSCGRASKWDSGVHVAGGQMWSLVTESKKGIKNRQEAFPLQIDAQYIVGLAWARQYGFRVAKNCETSLPSAFAIESPQTTFGGRGSNNNFFFNTPGAGGGLYNFVDTTGYTAQQSTGFPHERTAIDPGWGHYEVVGNPEHVP